MAFGSDFHLGQLRFQVTLCSRSETPDPSGTGIIESYINRKLVWADIIPTGLQSWIGSEQIDTPITHRIVIRWQDRLDMFDCVTRSITRPGGSVRTDLFRVRRMAEYEGRARFTILDCELERRDG